ncbi:MAG: PLP-dependent aminotransferase family protein [Alcaligenaceae bacterium]|nr:PLP-dependent aminotransferase family protein [Alcaligenaceae bacterium]
MNPRALSEWLQQWFRKGTGEPAYRQLYRLLRQCILEGRLHAGTRLPASRELATDLSISRNTVLQAYEQLTEEGYVSAAVGRGTFVEDISHELPVQIEPPSAGPGTDSEPGMSRSLSKRGERLITSLGYSERQHGAFMAGVPDVTEFPVQQWLRIHNRHWRRLRPELLSYAPSGGYPPLRQALSDYLQASRSVNGAASQVVVTSGIHQVLDVVIRMLCDPGDRVWVEEPAYWGIRNLLISHGMDVVGIPVDIEGMNPTTEQMRRPPRLIVVTPSHQYPLGMVMSLARRRRILEYARQHHCWILEDDYDSDFRYGGRPLPSLQGLDEAALVIYAGSFSKTLYPGLRLGYAVAPASVAPALAAGVAELYREGQLMAQAVMAEFLREGFVSSHMRRVRSLYAARRDRLIVAVQAHYGSKLEIVGDKAGLHLVLALPDHVDDAHICREAYLRGIMARPLSMYYLRPERAKKGLVLGYACVREDEIDPAFAILAGVIDAELNA